MLVARFVWAEIPLTKALEPDNATDVAAEIASADADTDASASAGMSSVHNVSYTRSNLGN